VSWDRVPRSPSNFQPLLKAISGNKIVAIKTIENFKGKQSDGMGVILGFAQSVVKRIQADDPFYPPLKSIEQEALKSKKLVIDLLASLQTGKSQVEITHLGGNHGS
jgi:hypothetical protein